MKTQDKTTSSLNFLGGLARHHGLILRLTKTEIVATHKGSLLGLLWSLVNPLLLLAIYTFIFSVVLKVRWGTGEGSHLDTAMNLFVGVTLHQFTADCLSSAPNLITANVNYVKKVMFPLETLAYVSLFNHFFYYFFSLVVLIVFRVAVYGMIPPTTALMPLLLLPFMLILLGVSWVVASLSVYLRDINQLIGTLIIMLAFMTPIFYPLSKVPEHFRVFIQFNPLTPVVTGMRRIILDGLPPDWTSVGVYWVAAICVAAVGHLLFRTLKNGFADVL